MGEIKGEVNIGIDESRNGQPWEIYVGVCSKNKDVTRQEGLKKGHKAGGEPINYILSNDDFNYIILPSVEKNILTEYRSWLACISSFLEESYIRKNTVQTLFSRWKLRKQA